MKSYRRIKGEGIKSNPNRSNSVFKPLIASSLALALGVSVASANDPAFYQQGANGTKGSLITNPSELTFGTTTLDSSTFYTFKINNTVDNEFKLYVTGDSNSWNAGGFGGKGQLNIQTNSMFVSTKGIAMGDSGNGTLTLDMWTGGGDTATKSFIMDLSGVDSSSYAFYGNLAVTGSSDGSSQDYSNKTITAKLGGKGIKGNIDLGALGKTNLIFSSGANIDGSTTISRGTNELHFLGDSNTQKIWSHRGTNTFIFDGDAHISSGSEVIYTGWYQDGGYQVRNTFIFNGNTILENTDPTNAHNGIVIAVQASAGTRRDNTYNYMTFNGATNQIIGKIKTASNANGIHDRLGENLLTFETTSTTNTITGEVNARFGFNTINFKGQNNTIDGIVTSSSFGTNTIEFTGSNNKINGDITATGSNFVVETTGGVNNITFSGATNTITGNITTTVGTVSSGTNTIVFSGSQNNNKITGNIISNGGRNNITVDASLTIEGWLFSDTSSPGSNNVSTTRGNNLALTITKGVYAHWGRSTNNIDMGEGSVIVSGAAVMAKDGTNNIVANTINLTSGQAQSVIGNNSDEGNAVFTVGGTNAITATNLTVNGNISSTGGSNTFNISQSGIISGNIAKLGSGQNNFTLTADNAALTLKGENSAITTLTALDDATNGNSLVLDGSQHENTTTIDRVANGENLIVKFSADSNAKTLKISSSDKANTSDLELKGISLNGASTNNTLDLTALGNVSILDAISVGSGQALDITLKDTNLNTTGWSNAGTSTINVGGTGIATANASLSGGAVSLSNLKFSATTNSTMTLKNTETTIATVTSTHDNDALVLDASSNATKTTISNQLNASNLTITMKGNGTDNGALLTLAGAGNAFKTLALGNNSTNNTLALTNGKTTITDQVSVGNGSSQELSLVLGNNTELSLTGGLTTTAQTGTSILKVKNATTQAILSGGTVRLSRLELMTEGTATSTLLFKNTTTTIDELFSSKGENVLKMAEGSQNVTLKSSAEGTKFSLDFADSGNTQAKTFTLTGGENTIKTLSVSDTATSNTLAVTGGHTTILDAINIGSGKNITLKLTSDTTTASDSRLTLDKAVASDGTVNILFDGGVNPADQIHHSTLFLKGANNQIDSVTSDATNAVIAFDGTAGATIGSATINGTDASKSGSLVFGFIGDGASTVNITNAVTVGNGATLGVSLGGSGNKVINGTIDFQQGSTLLVDFLAGNTANATLGSNGTAFTINRGSNSIINFHGANSGQLNGDGITIDGGDNTVNFIGSATMGGVILTSGTNTINVYGAETQSKAITGTVVVGQLASVSNTINLNDYSVLNLKDGENGANGSGNLASDAHANVLNFKGENAKLDGSFGSSDSGSATINVGASGKAVSGLITGELGNASIVFKEGDSKLTLQGNTHTLSSVTTEATNGILVLDASKNDVTATVSNASGMTIDAGKSITIALNSTSTNHNATFNVTQGSIAVDGTLGIAISGNGNGNRSITGNITFNTGSTLRVDFLENSAGSAILGGEKQFEIGTGKNSEINFYAGSTATLAGGGLKIAGGSNTVNFYGNATLGQVELESGNNTINVKEGVTATIENTASSLGSVNNTLNLDSDATLRLRAATGENSAIGSIASTSTNILNFEGDNAALLGGFGSTSGGSATINVKGLNSLIVGNISQAGVTFSKANATLTLQGEENTLSTLTSSTQGNKVILDASKNAIKATITSAVSGAGSVALRFGAGNESKTFSFSATGNTLSGVEFDERGSTNNAIAFTNGSNTISNAFVISQGQGLSVTLGDSAQDYEDASKISLSTQGLSEDGGSASLKVLGNNTANALISGGDIAVSTLDMIANTSASLTLQNANTTIGTLDFGDNRQTNTITLDATNNAVATTVNSVLDGNKLTVNFNGSTANAATLTLNNASTIKTVSTSGVNGLLNINADSIISDKVEVGSSKGLSISLNNANLTLKGNFENTGGNANLDFAGITEVTGTISTIASSIATKINVAENAAATLTGSVKASAGATDFTLNDNATLTLGQGVTTTGGITTLNVAGDQTKVIGNISTTGGSTNISFASGTDITVLNLENGTQTISGISLGIEENQNNALNLSSSTTTISGNLELGASNTQDLTINLQDSELTLANVDTKTKGALNINSEDSSLTATSIKANGNGRNNVQVATLTLNGNLEALTGAQNNIQASAIEFKGAIKADSNTADSNQNTIVAQNVTFSGAEITSGANDGGWFSQNIFEISGETNFTNSNLVIKANQKANTNTEKNNIFKFGGKVGGTIKELVASTINEDHNRTKNILSFDGQEASTLTIGDINKDIPADAGGTSYASGVNYIGANLTSGSGSDLKLSFNENQWSSEQYRANLDLTVTNEIQAKRGNNYINVSSLKAQTLTNDYGTNYIAVSGDFTANEIVSTWGGRNEIIVGGNATITTLNIGNNGNGNTATNKITFAGNNSQNTFLGDILIASANGTRKNELVLAGENAVLTLEGKNTGGTTHAITSLDSSGANTTLILDNSTAESGDMETTISTLSNGGNLTTKLNGKNTGSVTLALGGDNTLKALILEENANKNILDLQNSTSTQILEKVLVGENQGLDIKLDNTALTLTNGISGGNIELIDGAIATLGGGAIDVAQVKLGSSANATLNIQGSTATINKLVFQNGSTLGLSNAQTTINSAIDSTSTKLNIEMADSTLILGHSSNSLDNLTSTNGLVDLTQGKGITKARSAVQTNTNARNTLTIGNFTGNATFKLFASSKQSDQVIFNNPAPAPYTAGVDATPTNTATIVVVGGSDIYNITYDPTKNDNIMVADVSGANGQVGVVGGKSMIGISEVQVQLTEGIDDSTGQGNGKYYIGSIKDLGLKQEYQEVASSALTVNYDLYLANFNSLNKRMGELRDNANSQGVWARVFGGAMSNDFGAGSKTQYVTAQAGYDYALSVGENAKNYVGVAIAYGTSKTKGNTLDISAIGAPTNSISLSNVDSNMVEVGIYNSYVMDSGWYNDTIFKFDYIMSEFSLSNDPNQMSNTNNFAMVLSDEFGYRYKFAENEKGNWYIDPQVEVAFGYFNQSDFNRAMYESGVFTGNTIQASQDSIITLRTRAGLSLGKKFITEKGFASLYVGAFYEYDYINGGDAEVAGRAGGAVTQLDKIESNGRAIVNVGSNIGLTENARLYIDVEKSFGDKQRTFMQFNLGARYSF
ncbi:hypothetical protein [uncultured Helicobacter sp.]|uniref:hypothetical protein n=1 Tax=uncultured Helicobacter sp. TaxID=175537 RepID=UPI002635D69A|nr:hypothetical protein [uncultured Helicobacter sp.]